jgi:hypothetical protein
MPNIFPLRSNEAFIGERERLLEVIFQSLRITIILYLVMADYASVRRQVNEKTSSTVGVINPSKKKMCWSPTTKTLSGQSGERGS